MKTILLISPYWKEKHRWMVSSVKLAELWQRLGYNVVVLCMGSETQIEHISETLAIHSRKDFFLKDPLNFGISFGFGGAAVKLAQEIRPDYIIINKILFWSSWSIIRLRIARLKPLVLTDALVGMTWWPRGLFPSIIMGIGGWTMGWLTLLLAKRIVFFHAQPKKLLCRLGIAKKSQVIPTGIDPVPFGPPELHEGITITYTGRLESVKGVDVFLEATVPLKEKYPSLKIQVVGWYEEGNSLVSKYEREVVFTGLRDDIPDILRNTDIFVLPSFSEGLSNSLMEAMASSCACIASDVGGNAHLIQNGVSGFLFPVGDSESLRSHIQRLCEDSAKRKMISQAARERIDAEFSWKVVGKKYEDLFDR